MFVLFILGGSLYYLHRNKCLSYQVVEIRAVILYTSRCGLGNWWQFYCHDIQRMKENLTVVQPRLASFTLSRLSVTEGPKWKRSPVCSEKPVYALITAVRCGLGSKYIWDMFYPFWQSLFVPQLSLTKWSALSAMLLYWKEDKYTNKETPEVSWW